MITHHDGCFGCGQANLFGLQLETDGVRGRFFVKQDHQGEPGQAHEGIIATALYEAITLADGERRPGRLEVEFLGPAPVGVFVEVSADATGASASADGRLVARATVS